MRSELKTGRRVEAGPLTISLSLLALVALGGWYLWNSIVMEGLGGWNLNSPSALVLLGFVAGAGAFFAPCAVSLFPGYITYHMALTGGVNPSREAELWRSLRYGGSAAMGTIAFFALVGLALNLIGGVVSTLLIASKPLLALVIIGLGIVQLTDWTIQLRGLKTMAEGSKPAQVLFLYGFGYGLASAGCTLPVYVFIIILPLSSGQPGAALITFLSFALAMGLLMVLTSLLIGLSQQAILARFQAAAPLIKRLSGVVLILVGMYSGYFYFKAGM